VNVYVFGTGIRTTHKEFGGKAIWGVNIMNDGMDEDCHGHDTHVASIIAGKTFGVARNLQSITLYAVKVLNCQSKGYMSDIMAGVQWVLDHHKAQVARAQTSGTPTPKAIINMSLSGGYMASLNRIVDFANQEGILSIVTAGNEGIESCSSRSPTSASTAVTVAASLNDVDSKAWFSSFGSCVDIFAPGYSILAASNKNDTATISRSGTSMAAPLVTGVAAIWLSSNWVPEWQSTFRPAALKARMLDAANKGGMIDLNPTEQLPNLLLN
ncbi:peptidase S8/S53 domain-containing protein, partial [Gaertneriomyces semiglobifer]